MLCTGVYMIITFLCVFAKQIVWLLASSYLSIHLSTLYNLTPDIFSWNIFMDYIRLCWRIYSEIGWSRINVRDLLLPLSSGPRAYAPDAPQPIDLLCNPSVFKRSHLLPPVRLLVRVTRETPGSERWNYYAGEKHGRQFCLDARLPRNI